MDRRRNVENPVKIVRYSKMITFEDGATTDMQCFMGTVEEVRKLAEAVAARHGAEVLTII